MGSIIICYCQYNPINSLSKSSCSKVHLNIDVEMEGSYGPLFLSMKSISSSQCLTYVYKTSGRLGDIMKSLAFDTQLITTMNIEFGHCGRLLQNCWPRCSTKSITGPLSPGVTFFHCSQICLHISTMTSEPTGTKLVEHYRNYSTAACFRMSLYNLQELSPRAAVHLYAVSNGPALRYWSDVFSPETQPPIVSSSC